MTTRSSSSSSRKLQYPIDDHDSISKLPDELLQMIVSKLSTEEAVRTSLLSSRWVDVWKGMSHLVLDMRKVLERTPYDYLHNVSLWLARSMNKAIENHRGHLESCIIHYDVFQCKDATLQRWICTVTRLKHTKSLALINYVPGYRRQYHYKADSYLHLLPYTFSHHSLTSLSLCGFYVINPYAFSNCENLKTLKLLNMAILEASVLSEVLAACTSLEVIVLQVDFITQYVELKIENNNLKFLQMTFPYEIDRIEVYATCLDVLDIRFIKGKRENFTLAAPNIQVNKNAWVSDHGIHKPHLFYNVSSYLAQEEKNIWHELLRSEFDDMSRDGSLSVSVDLTDPKEVEILKEVLLMWATNKMIELEIFFKNKKDEGECSTNNRAHKNLLEDAKPFPNAAFRVYNVRLYNFDGSNEEEFAFASRLVTQKTVVRKMMIETSSFPLAKKLKVEAAVDKLMELPKGYKRLRIECF